LRLSTNMALFIGESNKRGCRANPKVSIMLVTTNTYNLVISSLIIFCLIVVVMLS